MCACVYTFGNEPRFQSRGRDDHVAVLILRHGEIDGGLEKGGG